MKTCITIIFSLTLFAYASKAQVVTSIGFEQDEKRTMFSIPDSIVFKNYADSLSQVFENELLTGYVYNNLHELASNIQIEYRLDNGQRLKTWTDSQGRFFITAPRIPDKAQIWVDDENYYLFDSVFSVDKNNFPAITIALEAKYKIIFMLNPQKRCYMIYIL